MKKPIFDLEVADILPALQSVYVDTDGIDHELAVNRLLTRCTERSPKNLSGTDLFSPNWKTESQCSFALDELETVLSPIDKQNHSSELDSQHSLLQRLY